ncbi:Uncharacterised protein [Vibrio cholerae]|nr:Uncharacterised protein [Vibrio cholerae]
METKFGSSQPVVLCLPHGRWFTPLHFQVSIWL